MRWLDGITTSMDMSLSNSRRYRSTGKSGHDAIHGVTKSQTGLSNQTTPHPLCQDILVNGCLEQGVGQNLTPSTPPIDLVWQYPQEQCTPLREKSKYEKQASYIFSSVFLVLLWVPVSCEGFCFVLSTCDFLLSCWGGLLRSTVSCEGHIHGPTLCKFSFNLQTTEIRSCPHPFIVLFLFHVGLFLLSCRQGPAANT